MYIATLISNTLYASNIYTIVETKYLRLINHSYEIISRKRGVVVFPPAPCRSGVLGASGLGDCFWRCFFWRCCFSGRACFAQGWMGDLAFAAILPLRFSGFCLTRARNIAKNDRLCALNGRIQNEVAQGLNFLIYR